jgi:phospholipase C
VKHVVNTSSQVLTDIKDCKLAQVSWVTPGNKESDHPLGTNGSGPGWVASVLNKLGTNPACPGTGEVYWEDTAIFITWDDWGGWYDHVKPFRNGQPNGWGKNFTYGFRVPLLVVSAYTPAGFVENAEHDSGSLLRFIETNFSTPGKKLGPIPPGTYADAYADDSLQAYFTLDSPRSFKPIHVNFYFKFFMLAVEDRERRVFNEMAECGLGCWF